MSKNTSMPPFAILVTTPKKNTPPTVSAPPLAQWRTAVDYGGVRWADECAKGQRIYLYHNGRNVSCSPKAIQWIRITP